MNFSIKKIKHRFQKLHLIDLIGVGIFCICLLVIGTTFLRKSAYAVVTIRVSNDKTFIPNVYLNAPADWYIQNLTVGLTDKDFLGRVNTQILDTYYYPRNLMGQTVYVKLKVQSVYNKNTGQYSYNGAPLLIGELQTFKIKGLSVQGVVLSVGDQETRQIQKRFVVKGSLETQYNEDIKFPGTFTYKGIRNFLADQIKPGMMVTDNHGNEVVKILEVKKSPGEKEYVAPNGVVNSVVDLDRQQVDLSVEFVTTVVNGQPLFREEEQLILGHWLNLDFPDFTVYLTLMDVKPE